MDKNENQNKIPIIIPGLPTEKSKWKFHFQKSFSSLDSVLSEVSSHCNKLSTITLQLYDFLDSFLKKQDHDLLNQREISKCYEFSKAIVAFAGFCSNLNASKWLNYFISYDIHHSYECLSKMWDVWQSCAEEFRFRSFEFKESLLFSHCQDLISIHTQLTKNISQIPPKYQNIVINKLDEIEVSLSFISTQLNIGKNQYIIKHTDWITIKENIGVGGYAAVHLAKMKATGQLVAVKEMKAAQLVGKRVLYMKREIDALMRLDHPNVVKLIGVTVTYPFCIVTNYIPNGCLTDVIHSKTPNPRATPLFRSKVALDTARALEYIHKIGLLHRDFKPPNVLLDENDRGVVCDLGLARVPAKFMSCELGTMQWCAPELMQSGNQYDSTVDVYAWGITLWELWTLESPYRGLRQIQFANLVLHYSARPTLPKEQPKDLVNLLNRCWAQNRKKRPPFRLIREKLETGMYVIPGTDVNEFMEYVNSTKEEHQTYMKKATNQKSIAEKALESLKKNGAFDTNSAAALRSVMEGNLLDQSIIDIVVQMASTQEMNELGKTAIETIAKNPDSDPDLIANSIIKLYDYDPEFVIQIIRLLSPNIKDKTKVLKNIFESNSQTTIQNIHSPHIVDIIVALESLEIAEYAFDMIDYKFVLSLLTYYIEFFGFTKEIISVSFTTLQSLRYLLTSMKEKKSFDLLQEDVVNRLITIFSKDQWKRNEQDLLFILNSLGQFLKSTKTGQCACDILDACSHFQETTNFIINNNYIETICNFLLSSREIVVSSSIEILRTLRPSNQFTNVIYQNSINSYRKNANDKIFSFIISLLKHSEKLDLCLFISAFFNHIGEIYSNPNLTNKEFNEKRIIEYFKLILNIAFEHHKFEFNESFTESLQKALLHCDPVIALLISKVLLKSINPENSLSACKYTITPILTFLYQRRPPFSSAQPFFSIILKSISEFSKTGNNFKQHAEEIARMLVEQRFVLYLHHIPLLYPMETEIPNIISQFVEIFQKLA